MNASLAPTAGVPTRSPAFLRVDGLNKNYGEHAVLRNVSFSLDRGKCLALLGPSGCGKSTLLNIVAGLLPADGGRILLGDDVIEEPFSRVSLPPQKRRFSVVFQDLSLWPHMTAFENVNFALENHKLSGQERQRRVEEALKRVGILACRNRLPATLSGGQQQRVAIARAIVGEPSVLLMDEPLAALDANLRENLRDEIAALIRRLGITTIYVTHDHSEAMTIAHHVAVMNEGRIEQLAEPRTIFDSPATTFVASFLGSANSFRYTPELEAVRDAAGEPVFPEHPRIEERGYLMVRREYVRIFPAAQADEFPSEGKVQWEAACTKCGFAGERYEVQATTRQGETFRAFSMVALPLDSKVIVAFDPRHIVFVER